MPPMAAPDFPTMRFQGFSDASYRASDVGRGENSFAVGQFNLFMTSSLSDRMGILAELVVEANDRNEFGIDLERLLWRYAVNEYLNVSVGRYHTAIGWYNTAYHHASWLQTAVGRPFIFAFEDEGGLLPIHNVGLSVTGRIPSGRLRLRYVGEIGNGRASRSPLDVPTQNTQDENRGKAVNLGIAARPEGLGGFEAGFSVFHDRLTPRAAARIDQTILAGYAVYQSPATEWLNEGVFVRHAVVGSSQVDYTKSFYTQVSRRISLLRPYLRYQYVEVPDGDPYFPAVGLMHGPSLGVRVDLNAFAAFKVQFDHTIRRREADFGTFTSQVSFVF
jgi:hypothetical protein